MTDSYQFVALFMVPLLEKFTLSGEDNYEEKSVLETKIYKGQLNRQFPIPVFLQSDLFYAIKPIDYNYGTFNEVMLFFNVENDRAQEFAQHVEDNIPDYWDDTSKLQLELGLKIINSL